MDCKFCGNPTGGTVQIYNTDIPICNKCWTNKTQSPLYLLLKIYYMYEQHGDAMSRYAHEIRALLRNNGLIK